MNERFSDMLPKCCNMRMKIVFETPKFLELVCQACGDVVYVKKSTVSLPQLPGD
jgi:hypothetical protein